MPLDDRPVRPPQVPSIRIDLSIDESRTESWNRFNNCHLAVHLPWIASESDSRNFLRSHGLDQHCHPALRRIERKFFIKPGQIHLAYALLRQVCRPDRDYPSGRINSLYFDSDDLDQHERSTSGEFIKDKVRVRWYGAQDNLPDEVPVFLELKSRRGFASSKRSPVTRMLPK